LSTMICTYKKCGIEFLQTSKSKGTHCPSCRKIYQKEWYLKNKEKRDAQIKKYDKERIAINRKFICDYLKENPCIDCGESDIIVLEFDHQSDKTMNISEATYRWGLSRLKDEVKKCVIRCANCHRRKTAKDFNWYRLDK